MSRKLKVSIKRITVDTSIEEAELIPSGVYAAEYPTFYMSTHPLAYKCSVVPAARHNASIKLGHWLTSDEIIRYLDGNTRNIDPENLEVMTRSEFCLKSDPVQLKCDYCGKEYEIPGRRHQVDISRYQKHYCSTDCQNADKTKLKDLTPEELQKLVWETSIRQLAADYEVSHATIRDRCIEWNLHRPPQYYWRKIEVGKTHMEALAELGYKEVGDKLVKLEELEER